MGREEVLLKEYETCQLDINSSSARYWTVVGIFLPLNTAFLGWIGIWIVNTLSIEINHLWNWVLILFLAIGMLFVLYYLKTWLERVNSFIRVNYFRMREIEKVFGMRRNLIADALDNHWKDITNEQQNILKDLYKKHKKSRAADAFKNILYVLSAFWGILVVITLTIIIITLINYY